MGGKEQEEPRKLWLKELWGSFRQGKAEGFAGLSLLSPKEHFQELSNPQTVQPWESKDLGCKYFGEASWWL